MKDSAMPYYFPDYRALYNQQGERLYLTADERRRFLIMSHEIGDSDPLTHTLCETLAWTGCRISELLALRSDAISLTECNIRICSLKKRGKVYERFIPISEKLAALLDKVHQIEAEKHDSTQYYHLWPWHRSTALARVKQVMAAAKIEGSHANCRGLRHAFAAHNIAKGVSLDVVSRLLGHSDISVTMVYTNVSAPDLRNMVAKTWEEPL